MLLGDTFYYKMRRDGTICRQVDFDSCAPCHVRDSKCQANEIAVWKNTNWDGEVCIAAGKAVRKRYASDDAIYAALKDT